MLRKLFAALVAGAFAASLPIVAAGQETIVVYFQKGFYPAEDKAVDELVAKFQKKTGVRENASPKIRLSTNYFIQTSLVMLTNFSVFMMFSLGRMFK